MTPVLGALIGVIVAVVLISVVVVYCVRCRSAASHGDRHQQSPKLSTTDGNSTAQHAGPAIPVNSDAVKLESFFNSRKKQDGDDARVTETTLPLGDQFSHRLFSFR
jgi:hypothetical protein